MKLGVTTSTAAPLPEIALGIDVGPTRSAVAIVRYETTSRFRLELGMYVASNDRWLRAVIADVVRRGGLIAVECLIGFAFEAKRVQALVETARVEGRLLEAASAAGAAPLEVPAKEWRGALLRTETPSDDQVRIAVEGLCPVIPAMRESAREHVYDAAGLAIYALARGRRRPVMLPGAVERALLIQQAQDKASRRAKEEATKAAKALGLPVPGAKRSPTRAQSARRSAAAKKAWAERAGR